LNAAPIRVLAVCGGIGHASGMRNRRSRFDGYTLPGLARHDVTAFLVMLALKLAAVAVFIIGCRWIGDLIWRVISAG